MQDPARYREAKKKIQVNKICSADLANDAEICLDSIYPKTWIWQFIGDKDVNSITELKFDKKIEIVNENVKSPFIGKVLITQNGWAEFLGIVRYP